MQKQPAGASPESAAKSDVLEKLLTDVDPAHLAMIRRRVVQLAKQYGRPACTAKLAAEREILMLQAVSLCLQLVHADLPEMRPVLVAFARALERYRSADAWTLDEAFDVSRRKGAEQRSEQFRRKNSFAIWLAVDDARAEIKKRKQQQRWKKGDDNAFQIVGKEYNRSEASIKEIYYAVETFHKFLREEGEP